VAAIADPHFKLEPHQRDGGALGAALAADSLPTFAAVMLWETRRERTSSAMSLGTGCCSSPTSTVSLWHGSAEAAANRKATLPGKGKENGHLHLTPTFS